MKINKALILVDKYRKRNCPKPKDHDFFNKDRGRYYQIVYTHWAANEVYEYLDSHRDSDPMGVMEEMRYMADQFAAKAKTPQQNFMFSVLYDTVTDIYDTLLVEDY